MSLSSADITHLEAVLAQGKKPKVMFTDAAGQVAGKAGKVVALEDAREGDFVLVAFGSDQLPFSPAELRLPARGESARARAPRQREPEPAPKAPSGPGLLPEESAPSPAKRKKPTVPESKPDTLAAPAAEAAPVRKKTTRSRAAAAKHPELTVTLAYEDGEWSAAAAKGARTLVKGVKISHTAALAMCAASESPEIDELVSEVVEKIRSEAADEAARLRRQLEEAEARLAELG